MGLIAIEPTTEILAYLPRALIPPSRFPRQSRHIVSLWRLRPSAQAKDRSTLITISAGERTMVRQG